MVSEDRETINFLFSICILRLAMCAHPHSIFNSINGRIRWTFRSNCKLFFALAVIIKKKKEKVKLFMWCYIYPLREGERVSWAVESKNTSLPYEWRRCVTHSYYVCLLSVRGWVCARNEVLTSTYRERSLYIARIDNWPLLVLIMSECRRRSAVVFFFVILFISEIYLLACTYSVQFALYCAPQMVDEAWDVDRVLYHFQCELKFVCVHLLFSIIIFVNIFYQFFLLRSKI